LVFYIYLLNMSRHHKYCSVQWSGYLFATTAITTNTIAATTTTDIIATTTVKLIWRLWINFTKLCLRSSRFVAIILCGCHWCGCHGHGLWPSWLWSEAIMVCGHMPSLQWPSWSWFVSVMVCGHHCCSCHGCGRQVMVCGRHGYGLWPSWFVAVMVMVCGRHCRTLYYYYWRCCCVRLREIPAEDLNLASQSIRCQLAGITAGTEAGLSQAEIIQSMWQVFAGKPLLAVVKVRINVSFNNNNNNNNNAVII